MNDCVFCKIIAGEILSEKLIETEKLIVIKDISPKAPTHLLIIPKEHIESAAHLEGKEDISGAVFTAAAKLSGTLSLQKGFRIVTNCGEHGRQSVPHLHFHLLAGKTLSDDM